jgi:proteasome lid subunit RPN8/RPN11
MAITLHLGPVALEMLTRHASDAWPEECCGLLVGETRGPDVHITSVISADNIADGDRNRAYQVDWRTLLNTVRRTRRQPQKPVGFYHSHSDGSVRPSKRDRERAWLDHSYLLLTMKAGQCTMITSWRILCEDGPFEPEPVAFA